MPWPKGKPLPPEVRAKLSAARTGKRRGPMSDEQRANIRASMLALGLTRSPETRAKISAAQTGKPKSPEHCAAISAGKKAAFARRRTEASAP
jgi:NUMOD3 motif